MRKISLLTILIFLLVFVSCEKEAGVGGRAKIKGKIFAKDYNASFTQFLSEFYAPKEDVYIVYGDNEFYNDKVETNPDGLFEFSDLRKGNYTIFVYSKDTTGTIDSGKEVISVEIEILEKKEEVELEDLVIIK